MTSEETAIQWSLILSRFIDCLAKTAMEFKIEKNRDLISTITEIKDGILPGMADDSINNVIQGVNATLDLPDLTAHEFRNIKVMLYNVINITCAIMGEEPTSSHEAFLDEACKRFASSNTKEEIVKPMMEKIHKAMSPEFLRSELGCIKLVELFKDISLELLAKLVRSNIICVKDLFVLDESSLYIMGFDKAEVDVLKSELRNHGLSLKNELSDNDLLMN